MIPSAEKNHQHLQKIQEEFQKERMMGMKEILKGITGQNISLLT
jgi:hypothetical protein